MPISSVLPSSFKQEILDGIHAADDEYKMALFTTAAALGAACTHYAGQAGEVTGHGYTKGGIALTGRKSGVKGTTGYMTFDDPRWVSGTFTAHGALIYNASKQNRAVAVINFGQDYTCTNGTFAVSLPEAGADAIVTVA
jgi:hypothetical protein